VEIVLAVSAFIGLSVALLALAPVLRDTTRR
jgi:hypothetical protein